MANLMQATCIFLLLFLIPQAEQTVFLSAENANRIIQRHKRANFIMIEELFKGNLERECYEEICTYEEARETYEDKEKTDQFWKGYYDGRQCSSNPCKNNAVCRDTIRSYTCSCPERYKGKNCQMAVNECHPEAEDGCQHFCEPKYGHDFYMCSCAAGYKLGEDEKSCHPAEPYACGQLIIDDCAKVSYLQDGNKLTFPWQVLLLNAEETQHCSGVIISQTLVLTTAKCTEQHSPSFVIVGIDDSENKQKIKVEGYRVHSKYSRDTGDNNIALVKLQDSIKFHKHALPICIPQKDFAENVLMPRVPGIVSGWKLPSIKNLEFQRIKFSVKQTDKENCELAFNVTQTNRLFCGMTKSVMDSALVDGSHFTIEYNGAWFLVGMMGTNNTEASSPNVFLFTKISRYIMWLMQNSR
ncbi:vitamin K-dependent protein Z [Mantella aurantiaca]